MLQEVPRSRATTAVIDQGEETAVLELDTNTQGDDIRSMRRKYESGESVYLDILKLGLVRRRKKH